jgi:hypothetical protein
MQHCKGVYSPATCQWSPVSTTMQLVSSERKLKIGEISRIIIKNNLLPLSTALKELKD